MAEYKSIHKGQEIDEAVTRTLNLSENLGVRSDKMMSQKAITQELEKKTDKIEKQGDETRRSLYGRTRSKGYVRFGLAGM